MRLEHAGRLGTQARTRKHLARIGQVQRIERATHELHRVEIGFGHSRIVIDEPAPNGTALHLPLDDPGQAPDGYPIKADTKSGLYWAPGSSLYDDASAEIWFASEEIARTNGFVRAN